MKKCAIMILSMTFLVVLYACGGITTDPNTSTPTATTTLNGTTNSSTNVPTSGSSTGDVTTIPSGTTTTKKTTTAVYDEFWDKNHNGTPDWQEEEITLTYASWQHTSADIVTIESLMVQAFTEKYPNITVNMQIVSEDTEWDASFMALAEPPSTLPDVFLIRRLGNFLPYNILADITEYFDHDPDTDYIFDSVYHLGTYQGRRYAVPTFIFPQLWIVNLDILDAAGIQAPGYDWTYEQMKAIAEAATNESTHVIGMYGAHYFYRELPKVLKLRAATTPEELAEARKWYAFGFDGEVFHFDDPSFLTSMNDMRDALSAGYCVHQLSSDLLTEWYLSSDFEPRYNGKVALWRDASWSAKNYFPQMFFNWDVYPGPDGVTGGNTDIAGVSYTSEHKEAAYQLLKWMSYSEEGLLKRYELFEEFSDLVSGQANNYGYPIVDYGIDGYGVNQLWETIPYGEDAPGFVSPEFIEALRNGAYWVNKETIGWDEADLAVGSYISQVINNETTYAAVRETMQTEGNAAYQAAIAAMDLLIAEYSE